MEGFVFSGNRRRWPYLRVLLVTAAIGGAAWLAACCTVLLQSPTLPDLGLDATPLGASPAPHAPVLTGLSLAPTTGSTAAVRVL